MVGQRCGDLGGQACLAGPGLTADEHRLAVAALDPLPRLLERREFRGAAHQRAAAACDQFGWKRWWHPLRHAHNVAAQTPAGRIVRTDYRGAPRKCLVVVMTRDLLGS